MPKCENCYHQKVCEAFFDFKFTVEKCEDFKDKSLIVELPCKVGETVYILEHVFCSCITPEVDYYEIEEVQFEGASTYKIWLDGCDYDRDEVGKMILFTREEAEKALEELKNGIA